MLRLIWDERQLAVFNFALRAMREASLSRSPEYLNQDDEVLESRRGTGRSPDDRPR